MSTVDETTIDHALLDALRKADPGPYPKRIPYAATVRGFLPDPVTALRWATYTAAGTVVLGGAALIVKAMGITYEAPPVAAIRAPQETAPQEAVPQEAVPQEAVPQDRGGDTTAVVPAREGAPVKAPAAAPARVASVTRVDLPPSEPDRAEPVMLVAEDVGKVTVVPAAYEAKHAAPDVGLNLLGMRVAVDLS